MKIYNDETSKVFIMPHIEAKYINRAKKAELKLLYYIFANAGKTFSIDKAAKDLEEPRESITAALAFWRCAGVVSDDENAVSDKHTVSNKKEETENRKDSDTPDINVKENGSSKVSRSYSLSDITRARKEDASFGSLITYLEKLTGKLYNAAEQGIVLYLYDTLAINYEVIMGVAQYCVSNGKSSLRYIEKTIMNIDDEGVKTYAELETYLGAKKKKSDFETEVKQIIGAENRALTKAEKIHIGKWSEYNCSTDLVALAYEKTVAKINKPQISYMSKIIEDWHQKGLDSPQKIEEFYKGTESARTSATGSDGRLEFNLDDIFEKPVLTKEED